MATTDYTIDDTMIGAVLTPADGYLVSLSLTTPSPKYEVPSFDEGKQIWVAGYMSLRGERDHQAIYCNSAGQCGHVSKWLVGNQSLAYRGGLKVQSVPKGAVYSLTLSDSPNRRAPSI